MEEVEGGKKSRRRLGKCSLFSAPTRTPTVPSNSELWKKQQQRQQKKKNWNLTHEGASSQQSIEAFSVPMPDEATLLF